ncbi:HNH endonuclease [Pseudomonas reactans]|uniref:HNH endonuclease n=1 Tax=Pseudomonas reactans TaxID=117680 RepID=UPI0015A158F7|nr:HNH endonuclease [Pseudomonas reactans]NWC86958.1 HNH endonuclease [Pseudomonas reactans]NWD28212.1 HNH endonuclease [Pseudomonas reactans]
MNHTATQQHLPMPELSKLRENFVIDPESLSGLSRLKASRGRNGRPGPVLSTDREGYYRLKFKNVHYRTHRVVYFMHTGKDPGPLIVDHVDGDITNNNVCNLRCCTNTENLQNARKRGKGDLPKGISRLPNGMYQTQVTIDGIVQRAVLASLHAARRYLDQLRKRFHGEFARN